MNKVTFDLFKNIIIQQNKELLHQVAKITGKDEKKLVEKYIHPDFYLPIILKTNDNIKSSNKVDIQNKKKLQDKLQEPKVNETQELVQN